MSEVLEDYKKRKLDHKLKLSSEAPLSYVKRQADLANEILFCVEIPWSLLLLCIKLSNSASGENVNYVDFLKVFSFSFSRRKGYPLIATSAVQTPSNQALEKAAAKKLKL